MPAHNCGRSEVNDGHEIASEDSVVLGDQVVLLAVGIVGVQRCGRVEAGQEPPLPPGPRHGSGRRHPLARAAGRRGQTGRVDGPDDPAALAYWVGSPDLRPFEHTFGA
jgi:hypothetical protein